MLSPAVKIFLCAHPTDMRRSFDKLAEMTRSVLLQDPLSGHLFVFFTKGNQSITWEKWCGQRSSAVLLFRETAKIATRS